LKKYIVRILAFLPLVFLMPAVVYFVNPDNKFHSKEYGAAIADKLLEHKNVTAAFNYDKRLVLTHYIGLLTRCPDAVVLGGSRTMLIDSTFFPDSSIFLLNCGVNSSTLEDEMALYDLFVQRGWYPKKVVLGIDPYFFNEKNPEKWYGSVRDNYYDMCKRIGARVPKDNEFNLKYGMYKDLFNPYYFQKALLFWINTGNKHTFEVTDKKYNEKVTLLHDGTITYGRDEREWTQEKTDELARNYISDVVIYFKNFTRISPATAEKYEKFLAYLKSKNVEVFVLYEPYHPICYQKYSTDPQYKTVVATEDYCRNSALQNGATFYGSLNPTALGLRNTDFFDGDHLRKESLKKVLRLK
jgi:hypothetical protein